MSELTTEHYRLLLGLDDSWVVDSVDFQPADKRVVVSISHGGGKLCCPECEAVCPQADLAPVRKWRHLDTMQFQTEIHARTPRSNCSRCGVKTIRVPWSGKHSRFTLLFEALAIDVLQACSSIKNAAGLLGIDWNTAHAIMERAVERGIAKRSTGEVHHVGIDEKSFGQGHDYITVMTDLDGHRVLDVAEGRTIKATDTLWETLPAIQRKKVRAVAMDMWKPFMASTGRQVPEAEIVTISFTW